MKDSEIAERFSRDPTPWKPKHRGKLLEELNEAGAIVARCLIQGIDEANPDGGELNKTALENELADVMVNIVLCVDRFKLNETRMDLRCNLKEPFLRKWHFAA